MAPGKCCIKADFLEHAGRNLFYLQLEPADAVILGSVLFLPPFAEEMNKSRRVVASQARELADAGYRVMLLDLSGCGDSTGDFVDASWHRWLEDAQFAARSLLDQDAGPLTIWGLRMGALLACELAHGRPEISRLVLWQPVLNGEQQVDQFLRLRAVSSSVNGASTFDRGALWNELRAGRSLEVAGYELSSTLALEMAKARLNDFCPAASVHWLEIGVASGTSLSPGSDKVVAHWRDLGIRVMTNTVQGEAFWRAVDAELNPELQRATLTVFAQP